MSEALTGLNLKEEEGGAEILTIAGGRGSARSALKIALDSHRARERELRQKIKDKAGQLEDYSVLIKREGENGIVGEIARIEKELDIHRVDFYLSEEAANRLEIKFLGLDVSHPSREVPRILPTEPQDGGTEREAWLADLDWITSGVHLWKAREVAVLGLANIDSGQISPDETHETLEKRRAELQKQLAHANRQLIPIFRAEHARFLKFGPRKVERPDLKVVPAADETQTTSESPAPEPLLVAQVLSKQGTEKAAVILEANLGQDGMSRKSQVDWSKLWYRSWPHLINAAAISAAFSMAVITGLSPRDFRSQSPAIAEVVLPVVGPPEVALTPIPQSSGELHEAPKPRYRSTLPRYITPLPPLGDDRVRGIINIPDRSS